MSESKAVRYRNITLDNYLCRLMYQSVDENLSVIKKQERESHNRTQKYTRHKEKQEMLHIIVTF